MKTLSSFKIKIYCIVVPLLYIDFKESKLEARHNNNKGKSKVKKAHCLYWVVRVELGTMLEQEMLSMKW